MTKRTRNKRNVTVTLDDATARWARVEAARRDVSVSRLLGDLLLEQMREERGYAAARRRYLEREPMALKTSGGYPGREVLHVRD